jgi:hypothetical protein
VQSIEVLGIALLELFCRIDKAAQASVVRLGKHDVFLLHGSSSSLIQVMMVCVR